MLLLHVLTVWPCSVEASVLLRYERYLRNIKKRERQSFGALLFPLSAFLKCLSLITAGKPRSQHRLKGSRSHGFTSHGMDNSPSPLLATTRRRLRGAREELYVHFRRRVRPILRCGRCRCRVDRVLSFLSVGSLKLRVSTLKFTLLN